MKATTRISSIVLAVIVAGAAWLGVARYAGDGSIYARPELPLQTLAPAPATAPLRLGANGRYFVDASGKAVYLTGSHTWNNLQDIGYTDPPTPFDFDDYLRFLRERNHNFIRLWRWETSKVTIAEWGRVLYVATHPWVRSGREIALDGKPRFDLRRFDESYFDRLRSRVEAAGRQGIYVSIMLFEGWAQRFAPDGYQALPFNSANNVNGIDCDLDNDDKGLECYTLRNRAVTAIQEAYVRKVIDTVNDLDNVLYEISNENHWDAFEWERHFLDFVRQYERTKPKQHPVGLTSNGGGGQDDTARLFASGADWVSPNSLGHDYRENPPAHTGSAVIITDTDHLWGVGGDPSWVWKSFLRGLNPIFMDPYKEEIMPVPNDQQRQQWETVRRTMAHAASFAARLDLNTTVPRPELASTGYCLADPRSTYLVYVPAGSSSSSVDLSSSAGDFVVEWFDPSTGDTMSGGVVRGGDRRSFSAPVSGDAVLYLRRQ